MKSHPFEFNKHVDFADVLGGKCMIGVGVGPEREAILLAVDPENQAVPFGRDEQPGWASFPRSVAEHPYPATVFRLRCSGMSYIDLPEVDAAFPFIQPLAGDSTLIVSGRCHYRNGDPEHNAVIYDQHGQAIRHMVFGDGIEDVQVGLDQRIWVSYFDEGIFGNYGWRYPMGADGLLCFNMDGEITWRFHAPGGFDSMADCYALNVANDAVWVCYYTDFPVVQVTTDGTVRGWENEVGGARAVVVDRQRVLLWGGYLRLLRFLVKSKSGFSYSWAEPAFVDARNKTLTESEAVALVDALSGVSNLSSETVVLLGSLRKADIDNSSWRIATEDGEISGTIKQGGPSLSGLKIDSTYTFTCVEETEEDFEGWRERRVLYLTDYEST